MDKVTEYLEATVAEMRRLGVRCLTLNDGLHIELTDRDPVSVSDQEEAPETDEQRRERQREADRRAEARLFRSAS